MSETNPKHETAKVAMEKYNRDGYYFAPWVKAQGNQKYPYNPAAEKTNWFKKIDNGDK